MTADVDPYDMDENAFRTDGRDACHWCYLRPQAFVWGPYGTRVCGHCQDLIAEGCGWDVVEELAARLTVRGTSRLIRDMERWRRREHNLMERWLRVRTNCTRLPSESRRTARQFPQRDRVDNTIASTPDEPFDLGNI